jgi:hypothetical protein
MDMGVVADVSQGLFQANGAICWFWVLQVVLMLTLFDSFFVV